jgi:hypothetical protein
MDLTISIAAWAVYGRMIPLIAGVSPIRIAPSLAGSEARLECVERPGSAATRQHLGGPKDLAASKADVRKAVAPKAAFHRARLKAVIALLAESKMAA